MSYFEQRPSIFSNYLESKGVTANMTRDRLPISSIAEAFEEAKQNGQQIILQQRPTVLHRLETNITGDIRSKEETDSGHSVTVTGITEDGNILVSSWGEEFILKPSDYNLVWIWLNPRFYLDFEVVTYEFE